MTDVTGFGLAGHGWELAQRAGVTVRIHGETLPLYAGALAAAEAGVRTGGDAATGTTSEAGCAASLRPPWRP